MANSSGLKDRPSRTSLRGVVILYHGSIVRILLPRWRGPVVCHNCSCASRKDAEDLHQVAEGSATSVGHLQVEHCTQGRLVGGWGVTPTRDQPLLNLALGP